MEVLTYENTAKTMMANDAIVGAGTILNKGGLVLFPTDTVWSIGCSLSQTNTYDRLFNLNPSPSTLGVEVLFDSIFRLKTFFPLLHPKIETLLYYHTRPLTILLPPNSNFSNSLYTPEQLIAVRVATDVFSRQLIEHLEQPIVTTFATSNVEIMPISFGMVSSSIIRKVDHVVKYRQKDKNIGMPAVVIKLNEKDELEFLRE